MYPTFSSITLRQRVLLGILLAASLPYLIGLGDSSIWDANEAYYAETPREMLEAGDYISPTFNYEPRVKKPVLAYWTVAGLYSLLGVSEFTERLPMAVSGLLMIATAFGLGYLIRSPDAGLLAAIVLATMPRMLMFSRRILIDVQLAMFVGLTLLCFALAEARPERRRRYLLLMYAAAGLGTLTKGPIAVLLPALVFLAYLLIERRLSVIRTMMLPTGALIVLGLMLPWYVLLYRQDGWEPLRIFFLEQNLQRYTETIGTAERGPLFYVPVMLGDVFPWSLFLPLALFVGVRQWSATPGPDVATSEPSRRVLKLLVLWIVVIVGFFSFSATKQDLYILPVVPAEAALIGVLLAAGLDAAWSPATRTWLHRVSLATAGVVLTAGAALLGLVVLPGDYPLAGVGLASVTIVAGGALMIMLVVQRRLWAAVMTLGATFTIVSWWFVTVTLPDFERYKPVRPLTTLIASRASDAAVIGYYKFAMPSMVFYLRRPILELLGPETLQQAFTTESDVYILMTESDYREVRSSLPGETYVLASRPLMDVKPRNFLAGEALRQILLVSNRPVTP